MSYMKNNNGLKLPILVKITCGDIAWCQLNKGSFSLSLQSKCWTLGYQLGALFVYILFWDEEQKIQTHTIVSAIIINNIVKLLLIIIITKENQSRKHMDVQRCLVTCSSSLILKPLVLHAVLSPFLLVTSLFLHGMCIHVANMIALLEASFFNEGV